MAKRHMADISGLIAPLRKQREEWLKVVSCPVCGKPSHKSVYLNTATVTYSHFENDVLVGSHQACPTSACTPTVYRSIDYRSDSTIAGG